MEIPFISNSPGPNGRYPINLYLDPEREIGRPALVGTPGLTSWSTPSSNKEVRGMHVMGGTLYVVAGNTLYSVNTAGTATSIGTVSGKTSGRVWMEHNALNQLGIVDGETAYTYSSGTLAAWSAITALCTPGSLAYQDEMFLVSDANGSYIYPSDLNETDFDDHDPSRATGTGADILAIASVSGYPAVMKVDSVESMYNSGHATAPLARVSGSVKNVGVSGSGSTIVADQSVFFLDSKRRFMRTVGQGGLRVVGTDQLHEKVGGYDRVDDVLGYEVVHKGHIWCVFVFPSADKTWVYDLTVASQGADGWFQWSSGLAQRRHRGNCAITYNNDTIIGDYENGQLYKLSATAYDDDGDHIRGERVAQAVRSDRKKLFFNSLEIEMGEGVGVVAASGLSTLSASESTGDTVVAITTATQIRQNYKLGITLDSGDVQWVYVTTAPVGSTVYISEALEGDAASGNQVEWYNDMGEDPQAMLRYSKNRGRTWSNERWASVGKGGEYENRIRYKRLGSARDMTFEWVMTDPVERVIYGATLDVVVGEN